MSLKVILFTKFRLSVFGDKVRSWRRDLRLGPYISIMTLRH